MPYIISNLDLENNSISPLKQFNDLWAVQKYNNEVTVISNSCLHRGSLITTKKTHYNGNIVCPIHRWTYDHHGNLLGNPLENFKECLPINSTYTWNNLIFSHNVKDIQLPKHLENYFDMSNYVHTKTELMTVNSSWEIFMEVYLDLYHVQPYHPGLGNFVDMNRFNWHFGETWSLQEVFLKNTTDNPNPYFKELKKNIDLNYPDTIHGALWLTIYPNIMLEWYPNTLVVSSIWPGNTPETSLNIIEYHHLDTVSAFDNIFVDIQLESYRSTADEDAEICELLQKGRIKEAGSYKTHPILEKGIEEFYNFVNTQDVDNYFKIR